MKIYFDDILIDEDYYIAIDNDYSLFNDNFFLGSTASNVFKISLDKRAVSFIPNKVILKDSNEKYLAVLKIDSIDDTDDYMYTYILTDSMIDLEFNYDASIIIEESETGSVSLLDILTDICNKAGIGLEVSSLSNNISVDWYDNTITARQYVGYIAELQGGYAFINEQGNLNILKHKQESKKIISYEEIKDSKLGEYHKITRVIYDNGVDKWEYGDETHNTLYINTLNPFITDTNVVSKIYEEIVDFEFYSFKTSECPIDFNIRPGNIVIFTDGINEYPTIVQYSISYNSGWSGGYSLEVATKRQEETKSTGINEKVKKIESQLNRTNASLSIIAQQSEEATEQVAQMRLETDNILLSVGSMEDVIFNSTIYEITKDNNFLEDKSYFYLDENGNYVYLEPSVDYQIGDEITTDVYEEDIIDGLEQRVSNNEMNISNHATTINIISTNIDTTTGDIQSVKTTTGYTLDKDGLKIEKSSEDYNTKIDNTGTYYKDGDTILGQTTKDGSIFKDMILYGKYYYGVDENLDVANFKKDDAMFVSEKYEDANGEVGFGHFYNGGD